VQHEGKGQECIVILKKRKNLLALVKIGQNVIILNIFAIIFGVGHICNYTPTSL
jgi:hypothetical protein